VAELGLDLGLLLSQIANFGIVLLVLWLVLYKPVLRKLTERADRIKKGIADADEANRLLETTKAQVEQDLAAARHQAREIVEQATRSGEQQRQEILARAHTDAQEIVSRAREQALREAAEGRVVWRQHVIDLAIASASSLLQTELDDARHRALIEGILDQAQAELPSSGSAYDAQNGGDRPS